MYGLVGERGGFPGVLRRLTSSLQGLRYAKVLCLWFAEFMCMISWLDECSLYEKSGSIHHSQLETEVRRENVLKIFFRRCVYDSNHSTQTEHCASRSRGDLTGMLLCSVRLWHGYDEHQCKTAKLACRRRTARTSLFAFLLLAVTGSHRKVYSQ